MNLLKKFNLALLLLPFLIFLLGIFTLKSIAPELVKNQTIFFLLGILVYFAISFIDFTIFKYYWKYLFWLVVVLLVMTYFLGQVKYGAVRWLGFKYFSAQPSEFAKIVVIMALSSLIALKKDIFNLKNLLKLILLVTPMIMLVLLQPDLGTAIIIFLTFIGILFYSGLNKIYFFVALLLFGVFSSPIWSLVRDYQKERILVFLNPQLDVQNSGYNVLQSIIAVGSGGLYGRGFGRGTQSHLQFLPVYWTDFIFASFAEEWGFIGAFVIIALYISLFLTLIYISYKVSDTFGSLLAIGTFFVFFFQFVINVGMNMGIMPVTGIPLPLFSYGGSSLITSFFLLGLTQSVWIYGSDSHIYK